MTDTVTNRHYWSFLENRKILLITAPRPEIGYSPVHFGDNRPPQGLGYLAAYATQNGHDADILDLYAFGGSSAQNNIFVQQEEIGPQLDIDIDAHIQQYAPDYIGMYVHTMSYDTACNLSRYLKKKYPHTKQICGGPHPTIDPGSMPESFDYVVRNEGEHALLDILDGKVVDRIIIGRHLSSRELEQLPWPDFDFFWGKPYNWGLKLFGKDINPVFTISASRGCPYRCRFCGVKYIYPHYTIVSAERLVDRMRFLFEKYGVRTFYFREDNFTAHLGRLERFCDLLNETQIRFEWVCESRVKELSAELIAKMASAGCLGLYIGCESGSHDVLHNMRKEETPEDYLEKFPILKSHGIATYTTWVYGSPGETQADRRLTDELIQKLKPDVADRFIYIGIPRSEFYDQILAQKQYEYIDRNGFLYPNGYLSLSQTLYGEQDPRVHYVRRIYTEQGVTPLQVKW